MPESDLKNRENSETSRTPGSSMLGSSKSVSPESLNKAESGDNFYNKSSSTSAAAEGVKAGAAAAIGDEAVAIKSLTKTLSGFVGSHHTGVAIGGGIAGFFIFIIIFSAGFLVAHELVTIEKTLVRYAFAIEEHFEQKDGSKIMQNIICLKNKNCKKGVNSDDNTDNEDSAAETTDPLATAMEDFPITSPAVAEDLSRAGITETTNATGDLELKNSDGENVTQDIGNDVDGTAEAIETALPEWDVGQEEAFIPLMAEHAGATFDPITPENESDPDKAIESDIVNGANENEIISETSVQQDAEAQNPTAAEQTAYSEGQTDTGILGNEINATDQAIAQGKTGDVAIDAGEAAGGNLGSSLLASTVASDLCSIKASIGILALQRVPKILTLLIRHGALLISLADELKSGGLSSGVVSKVMQLYQGNSTAPPTTEGNTTTPAEASEPFSSSAAWQSASGGTGGVPTDPASLPTANAGTRVYNSVNTVLTDSIIGSAICVVENSKFGFLANGIAGGLELFTSEFGSAVVSLAAVTAVQQTIKHVILPEVLKYFTPVGLDGLEDSVQNTNNDSAGLTAASSDYARSEGGNPTTNATATQLSSEATAQQNVAESRLPLIDRTLALSNPDSLASRILNNVPIGVDATINGAVNYLFSIPASIFHNLSVVFSSKVFASATATNAGEADGITEYAFTDSQLGKYDPIVNEQYLYGSVSYGGKSVQRITALGNPNTLIMNISGDEVDSSGNIVSTDLLHCYVDNYMDLQEAEGGSPDELKNTSGVPISNFCDANGVDLGDYDYNANTPVSSTSQDSSLDGTITNIYCQALGVSPLSVNTYTKCLRSMTGQISDDIGHFRQYILDVHVMKDYTSLTTNQ